MSKIWITLRKHSNAMANLEFGIESFKEGKELNSLLLVNIRTTNFSKFQSENNMASTYCLK
jgi:hypothetical protein